MKKLIAYGLMAAALGACTQTDTSAKKEPVPLDSEHARFSYAMGMDVGNSIHRVGVSVNEDAFVEGLLASLNNQETRLTPEAAVEVKRTVFQRLQKERQEAMQKAAEANSKEAKAFFAANGQRKGVATTASGLQYEVITQGTGAKPKVSDTVRVHYRGTLLDGTEFDSSYARGTPVTFPLSGVIRGWTEGLQLMPVGSRYKLYIPSELAYGPRGAGDKIGPNAALIFEVELLGIEDGKPKLEELDK